MYICEPPGAKEAQQQLREVQELPGLVALEPGRQHAATTQERERQREMYICIYIYTYKYTSVCTDVNIDICIYTYL